MDGGFIPDSFIDQSIKNRTVKLSIVGNGFLFRREIKERLTSYCKLDVKDLNCLYKERRSTEWFVVLNSEEATKRLTDIGTIPVNDRVEIKCENITKQKVQLKVHWVPAYVKADFFTEFFSEYGTVTKVENMWSDDARMNSGIRIVSICTDDTKKHRIPHMVRFRNGICMLITCPGRLPLCLKCNCLGHVRADCPNGNRGPRGPSYSEMLQREAGRETIRISKESVPPEEPPRDNTNENQDQEPNQRCDVDREVEETVELDKEAAAESTLSESSSNRSSDVEMVDLCEDEVIGERDGADFEWATEPWADIPARGSEMQSGEGAQCDPSKEQAIDREVRYEDGAQGDHPSSNMGSEQRLVRGQLHMPSSDDQLTSQPSLKKRKKQRKSKIPSSSPKLPIPKARSSVERQPPPDPT